MIILHVIYYFHHMFSTTYTSLHVRAVRCEAQTSSKNRLPLVSPATEWGLCVRAGCLGLHAHCWERGGGYLCVAHEPTSPSYTLLVHTMFAWRKFLVVSPLLSSSRSSYHGLWLSSEAHRRHLLLTFTDNALPELSRSASERESPWSVPSATEDKTAMQED